MVRGSRAVVQMADHRLLRSLDTTLLPPMSGLQQTLLKPVPLASADREATDAKSSRTAQNDVGTRWSRTSGAEGAVRRELHRSAGCMDAVITIY
jgi:hypothetical protein